MTIYRTFWAVALLVGFLMAGCTTDQPLVSNPRKARLEGIELYNRADYENAAGAFRNAVRQEPRDYRSHYYQGLTYERLGNVQQAIQSYKSALDVMKETPAGRDAIDFRQIVMNTLGSALAKYDTNHLEQDLLSRQATNMEFDGRQRAESYFQLAKVERYRRDADSALQAYYKASELDRNDFWLQKEAGLYMLQMGQNNRAVKSIQRANELRARDSEIIAAMQQLRLPLNLYVLQGQENATSIFPAQPLPDVELKVGDTPVSLPEQLPVD